MDKNDVVFSGVIALLLLLATAALLWCCSCAPKPRTPDLEAIWALSQFHRLGQSEQQSLEEVWAR